MIILFGWGRTTTKNYGQFRYAPCNICKHEEYSLIRIRTWFTLFFIPIIPYGAKRLVLCDKCGNGYDISAQPQETEEIKQRIQDAQDYA